MTNFTPHVLEYRAKAKKAREEAIALKEDAVRAQDRAAEYDAVADRLEGK